MTPDELPADMEAVVERLSYPDPGFDYDGQLVDRKDLRALLKTYQEQRRALERLANKDNEFGSEVQTIARAALKGKSHD
jgi:hypothetical protein